MSEYEKELERTVEVLRDKLQAALERQERIEKSLNASLYDVKALLGQMGDCIGKLKRLDEVDYDAEVNKILISFRKDKRLIEKELVSKHDAIHDRIINLLDRFKE